MVVYSDRRVGVCAKGRAQSNEDVDEKEVRWDDDSDGRRGQLPSGSEMLLVVVYKSLPLHHLAPIGVHTSPILNELCDVR